MKSSMPKKNILVLNLALFFATIAHAQTMVPKLDTDGRRGDVAREAKQRAMERFDAMDADKDGKLSQEEVKTQSNYLAQNFPDRDKNGDGFLSWEEYVGHDRWPR